MIASFQNVVKRYGNVQALDNVDFSIFEGEVLGLLGPNGAGKTTAIRALAGLIGIDGGEITLFGETQAVNRLHLKRNLGLVTQEVTVFGELTAAENLRFFGGLYGLRGRLLEERVAQALEFVGLTEHAKGYPSKFSGGMARRLNIACALVHEPKFIIMDEPTVGIDPQSRKHILDSVQRLAKQGTTILYTSHYMEEVQAIASRIVIMDQGHVIADGTLDDLIRRIQHEEIVRLTVCSQTPKLSAALKEIQGVKQVTNEGAVYTIVSQPQANNLDRILAVTQQHGGVVAVSAEGTTLEDVFLTLTGKSLRDDGEGRS